MPDRRRFLHGAAITGGAAMGWSTLPSLLRRALAIPANNRTGTLQDVQHIVVFMQENRAFDHYFGLMDGVRGFGDPRPLPLHNGHTVWRQPSSQHADGYVMPFWGDSRSTNAYVMEGAGQDHHDYLNILDRGRFDHWGDTDELHKRMAHYSGADITYYYALASAFTVCDAYHSSTLTQTYPNRLHLWTGCNGGGGVGGDPVMNNYGEGQTPSSDQTEDQPLPDGPLTWTTYAERLEAAGVSWKVYQEYDNFQDNILSIFKPFRPAQPGSSLYARGRAWVSEAETDPVARKQSDGERLVAAFRRDVASGALPQVSWIVTAADLSEHPSAAPAKGEHVCAQLIEALADHPEIFAKTVFIINYDEGGGFFDHMPPPLPPVRPEDGESTVSLRGEVKTYPAGDAQAGDHPLGLGVRTPTIIVSPWSRGGFVCSQVFDHTSVIRLMEARFGVMEPNISPWRRSVCGDLTSCFDFKTPNQDWAKSTLPGTQDFLDRVNRSKAAPQLTIPVDQAPTHQSSARRPSRPLPLKVHVDAKPDGDGLSLDLINEGGVGAVFQLHDLSGDQGPWTYTVGRGDRLSIRPWRKTPQALLVFGPDGFYRRFDTSGATPVTARLRMDTLRGGAVLTLVNHGSRVKAAVRMAAAYKGDGPPLSTLRLAPGAVVESRWPLGATSGWYDVTLSLDNASHWRQRMAGRFHDGRPGLTDPGIGQMVL